MQGEPSGSPSLRQHPDIRWSQSISKKGLKTFFKLPTIFEAFETNDWLKIDKYDKVQMNNNDFVEYDLMLSKHCSEWDDTMQYVSFRVKLVGRSDNSSQPVIFQNLRAIAIT